MTKPSGYYVGKDGNGRYLTLGALSRDLDRLSELTGPHGRPEDDDLAQAAARIPDEARRREAEELLARIRPVVGPHLDEINAAFGD